ncbi:MAG: hypothetical protein JW900_03605 [Anaerolineae bacterium]|nr:hypothetical protein [Anaerolineae bacterium]
MSIFDSIGKKIESQETGIRVSDLLTLPRDLRRIMNYVIREKQITLDQAATHAEASGEETQEMLNDLVEKGYLQADTDRGETVYRVHYGRTHPKDIPGSLWAALGDKIQE